MLTPVRFFMSSVIQCLNNVVYCLRGIALSPSTFSPSSGGSFQTTPSPTGYGGTPSPVAFSPMTPGVPFTPQTPGAGQCPVQAFNIAQLCFNFVTFYSFSYLYFVTAK